MADTITLLALRTKVQFEGDFENSPVFTPARLDVMINAKVRELWDLLLDGRPESLLKTQTATTTSGSDAVAFANDFYRLRLVEVLHGAQFYPVRPHSVSEAWRYQVGPSQPLAFTYRIEPSGTPAAAGIRLAPVPLGAYTVRIKYYPVPTALAADGDTLDTVNGFDELVKARVIATLKGGREGSDSSWWDREADRLEKRVREAASPIDAGEPYSLSGQAGGSLYDDWYGLREPL